MEVIDHEYIIIYIYMGYGIPLLIYIRIHIYILYRKYLLAILTYM